MMTKQILLLALTAVSLHTGCSPPQGEPVSSQHVTEVVATITGVRLGTSAGDAVVEVPVFATDEGLGVAFEVPGDEAQFTSWQPIFEGPILGLGVEDMDGARDIDLLRESDLYDDWSKGPKRQDIGDATDAVGLSDMIVLYHPDAPPTYSRGPCREVPDPRSVIEEDPPDFIPTGYNVLEQKLGENIENPVLQMYKLHFVVFDADNTGL